METSCIWTQKGTMNNGILRGYSPHCNLCNTSKWLLNVHGDPFNTLSKSMTWRRFQTTLMLC
ncbi:hypothetical protein V6Z11_D12G086500 [Gossypium hirsutum]